MQFCELLRSLSIPAFWLIFFDPCAELHNGNMVPLPPLEEVSIALYAVALISIEALLSKVWFSINLDVNCCIAIFSLLFGGKLYDCKHISIPVQ